MTERHSWVPYVGVVAGAVLLLKAVLIIGSENRVSEGAMAVLYLGGMVLALAACIGAGMRQRKGRRTLVAVAACFGLLAFVMVLSDAVAGVFAALSDAPWVGDEGPVGLLGVVLIGLSARARGTGRQAPAIVGAAT
jgi:hypothetical protein